MPRSITNTPTILLLGAFPPQAQGIPGYCGALAVALASHGRVRAVGFKAMYPRWLFPGVKTAMDPTSVLPATENLTMRHALTWYNPLGWLWHAVRTPADIVHIQWWSLPLFPVCFTFAVIARLRRKPVVVTVHNVQPHEASRGFAWASGILYRMADHLLVHSTVNRDQLAAQYPAAAGRITCVPMGIAAAGLPVGSAEARRRIGVPEGRPTLLFFGTIRPYKGLDILLRALKAVRKSHPEVQLVIAGMPWEPWARYEAIIEKESLGDHVHLALRHIPESEVGDYFAAADCVVLPYTHFDAQSAAGAQALSHGKPLIVTRTGGLPDLVAGDARWIAAPEDALALAEKIEAFFSNPEDATKAFEKIIAAAQGDRSWETIAAAHWKVYDGL